MADVRMTSENRWMKPRGLHFCLANIRLKKKTLKWLNHLTDEFLQNSLAYDISDENEILNNKDVDEIEECIKWVKSK
jgi:hypothetical protein